MNWFFFAIVVLLLFQIPKFGFALAVAYAIYWFIRHSSEPTSQTNEQNNQIQLSNSSGLSAGNLADLVLLRLELQNHEQQTDLNQRIDQLCTRYLADLDAVQGNTLWRKHRDEAWDLLNRYADTPLGLPPWRIAKPQEADTRPSDFSNPITSPTANEAQPTSLVIDTAIDLSNHVQPSEPISNFTVSEIPIPATPLVNDNNQANFSVATEPAETFTIPDLPIPETLAHELSTSPAAISTTINPADENSDVIVSEQPAIFIVDETEHSLVQPQQTVSAKTKQPDLTLNQYAWKPHEPSRLERALKTVSGWHSMAVPFLAQNIGWFIGVFCFIAGSLFLVHSTKGYASNLIAFFAFFIFTLALLFSGYRLRHKRPELEISSYVIFILSLLLIPLTTIIVTQLLITSNSLGLKLFSGLLVLIELSVFYFAVTLVSGLMDRSLQQGLPKFFLALTATQLLQVLLLAFPFWPLLMWIHLLIFALLSISIYLFANQWLQSIFIDRHKIAYFAAGTLIYAAIVSFVFITGSNAIELPAGYYGFFLLLLCGLLFFIDAQLKHWIEQHTYLSRFSFLLYGLSVLALCLVAKHPIAIPTLVLAMGLYAFMVWRYLTLTPLTILLACYFWLYHELVLQHLGYSWYLLASLPVLFSLYKVANWAIIKRQSAYLAVIVYRVLYGLLAVLTVWSLNQSEAGFVAMLTAITTGILIYYTLKSAPVAIFTPYSKIDTVSINRHENLLGSHWFYTIPALGLVTVFYTPRLPSLTSEVQFSLGVLLLAGFWAYYGLSSFFKAHSSSETTPIEQRLNSALFSVLVAIVPLWIPSDNLQRVIPLLLAGILILWLSYQLLMRGLFYAVLLVLVTAYLPIKAIYFPTPSGLATMLIGIGLWFWFWYRERQASSELILLKREQIAQKLALLPSCRLAGWYPLPSAPALFREVIAVPLEQVMCLLWFLGMKTLYDRFYYNQLSYAWLAAVFFIAVFSLLLIIRYSLLKLLPVPIALVLAAVLMMLQFWGLTTDGLLLATVIFALVSWQIVNYSLSRAGFIKLINTLNPKLDDIQQAGYITHHTAFFMVMVGVVSQLLNAGTHSVSVLFTLISTASFLWLSDKRYNQLIVRYLVLGFGVVAGIEAVFLTLPAFNAALLFVLLSLAVGALSIPTTTYAKPAANTAIFLVFIGVCLQLQHIIQITAIIKPLDYTLLLLAGVSLLAANAKDKSPFCTFSAFALWVLAALWLENSLVHAQQPFYLWLNSPFADLWLLLAVLSLGISLLSHWLKSAKTIDVSYFPPFNTVAMLCFVWSLLGTLTLFFSSAGHANLLALIFLVLLLALFLLSKNRSGAAQIRGFASANLVMLAAFNVLPVGLDGFALQSVTVVFAYILWFFASFALPHFNKRYHEWTVEPIFFPYLGFLLVALSACWWWFFNDFNTGVYCLELCVYCLLMLRYSRWTGFAWLASVAVVGSALCLENSFIHPNQALSLLLDTHTPIDSWLVLGLLSLSLSMLSHRLKHWQTWAAIYCLPLGSVAILCFVWSLLGSLTLFFMSAGQANGLAIALLILLLAVFPLAKDSASAAHIYGFAGACLSSVTAFSLLPVGLDGFALQSAMVLFSYTLWFVATLLLPRLNQRYNEWAIEPDYFPWLGLLLLVFSGCWWQTLNAVDMGIYCLELFGYCLLMLRYSNWAGFAWLAAIAFTVVGIAFNFDNESLPINLLLWGNLQLLLVTVWQRKGEKLAERWQWQQPPLAQAFSYTTQFIFISYLLIATLAVGFALLDGVEGNTSLLKVLPIAILLVLSLLHLLWVRFATIALHGFIHSLFLLLWAIYFMGLNHLFQPPLLLALWSLVLLGISKIRITYHTEEIASALRYWLRTSVILATLALLTYSENTLGELILSLAIVAGLSAMLGGKNNHSPWLLMARLEGLLLLHGWVFLLVGHTSQSLALLLPWYALQNILLAVLSMWFLNRLLTKPMASEYQAYYQQALQGTSWLIALGLLQLLGHGILVQQAVMAGLQPQWLLSPFDSIAAFSTGAIIITVGLRRVRHSLDSNWLYGIVIFVGALAFYSRLLWLGAAAVSLWDTAALIGCAYILFFLQGLFPSKPLYNTALLMPVLALFTVPLQLASPETSVTLIATGVLYAMVRRHSQQKIPLYLALLAFNAGVYLWIPSLVDSSRLIQIYVIPAALSSLMLLHLHSRELKPSVLMGSRLAAISSIYACATVDVFLRAELGVFILAMVLSVVGILLGIALRTRAFLYAGLSFLLLNIIGQALRLYPKKGLESLDIAIVLLVMGATILGFMFWFNEKKVAILQRINSIQVEMQTWE